MQEFGFYPSFVHNTRKLVFLRGHAPEAAFFGGFWADLITKLQYYHEKLHGVYMPQGHNSQKYTKIRTGFP